MLNIQPKFGVYNSYLSGKNNPDSNTDVPKYIGTQNPINLNYQSSAINNKISFKRWVPEVQNVKGIEELKDLIVDSANKRFVILTHYDPDHDGVATATFISEAMGLLNKVGDIFTMKPLKESLRFLDPDNKIKVVNELTNCKGEPMTAEQLRETFGVYDAVIIVDANNSGRLDKKLKKAFIDPIKETIKNNPNDTKKRIVILDHHKDHGESYFECPNLVKVVDDTADSASQLAMQLVAPLGIKPNEKLATKITAGLLADTSQGNHFKPNGIGKTDLEELSELCNKEEIAKKVAYLRPQEIEASKELLNNNLKITPDGQIGYIFVPKDLMQKHKDNNLHIDDLTRETLEQMDKKYNLKYYFVLKECQDLNSNQISVSLRSNSKPIYGIAKEYEGGGHSHSVGFSSETDNSQEFMQNLVNKLTALENS